MTCRPTISLLYGRTLNQTVVSRRRTVPRAGLGRLSWAFSVVVCFPRIPAWAFSVFCVFSEDSGLDILSLLCFFRGFCPGHSQSWCVFRGFRPGHSVFVCFPRIPAWAFSVFAGFPMSLAWAFSVDALFQVSRYPNVSKFLVNKDVSKFLVRETFPSFWLDKCFQVSC